LLQLFQKTVRAEFLVRPNRFIVDCSMGKKKIRAHLPNPGRMHELLLPGSSLYLVKNHSPQRKTRYTVVAVEREMRPVFLHTHLTNVVAHHLLDRQRVPGLKGYRVIKPEITMGKSRFDFLLQRGKREMILEVKSCTLFGKKTAMFPDAVTERGKRHLIELARHAGNGYKTGILIIIHRSGLNEFLPDYHTDLAFSRTLYDLRKKLFILPLAVDWQEARVRRQEAS
jgi:sugar fermentation stimulation protein A